MSARVVVNVNDNFIIQYYRHAQSYADLTMKFVSTGHLSRNDALYRVRCLLYSLCDQIEPISDALFRRITRFEAQVDLQAQVIYFSFSILGFLTSCFRAS